jgi:hypothetical protein
MADHDGPPEGRELVLLAGGFAASAYLRQALGEHLAERAEVLVVPDPGIAVLAGATHFAYAPQTRARRSRYTYGAATCAPFEEGTDPEELKIITALGEERCRDRFDVYVTAGQSIPSGEVVTHDYLPLYGEQKKMEICFYESDGQAPRYITDPGCRLVGTAVVPLKDVMHLELNRRGVSVSMRFGETEIMSAATVKQTGHALPHVLTFAEQ